MDLTGKVAVVTGASSGMGRAIARALGHAGATVFLVGLSEETERLAERFEAKGLKGRGRRADVADYAALTAVYDEAAAVHGTIDFAIHAAGVVYPGSIAGADPDELKTTIDTNLLGVMYGSQLALNRMEDGGYIINISSVSGRAPSKVAAYCASKFGVTGFTECLRIEAAPRNIRVSCVEPGMVHSEFNRHMPEEFQQQRRESDSLDAEHIADIVLAMIGLPPNVTVGELVVRPTSQLA